MNGHYSYGYGGPYYVVGQVLPQWVSQSTSPVHKKLAEAFVHNFKRPAEAWLELIDFLFAITVEIAQQKGLPPAFIKQRIEYAFTHPYR